MNNKLNYFQIEKMKYQHSKTHFIYFLFALVNLLIVNIQIYKRGQSNSNSELMLFICMDGLLIIQVLFAPLLIAIISSKSVELEESGNMLKVLLSSGLNLNKIYNTKLLYILKSFTLYISMIWAIILAELKYLGYSISYLPKQSLFTFLSFLLVSYFLILIHYNIAILSKKHIANLALALLGSLLGFISLFFTKLSIIPHSWYGLLISTKYVPEGEHFTLQVITPEAFPAILSFTLGIILYFIGKQLFLRRNYD